MASIPNLTGDNWYEWKKEVETYFMFIGCGGHVSSTKPGGDKVLEWDRLDQKVYAVIWFLINPNHRSPIMTTNSGKEAWAILVAEYQKDSATNRILLRQQFYSITHDPALPISNFIEDVFSIVRKLDAIGHKPSDVEVSDKVLIGLNPSWGPVRTTLMLQSKTLSIQEITSALKQYEANESSSEVAVKKEAGEASLLARDKRGRGRKIERNDDDAEEIDWGNSKDREGVCFRCGRHGHIAAKCVSDMPADVKRKILDHASSYANIVVESAPGDADDELFAFLAKLQHPPSPSPSPSNTPTVLSSPVVRAKKKRGKRHPKR
jgi:hypothetical protein